MISTDGITPRRVTPRQVSQPPPADPPSRNGVVAIGLIVLMGIAGALHLRNLSAYKIYPDSYQSLVTASNLLHHLRLVAQLGPVGMLYPQVFEWTRPLYPALIALLSATGLSLTAAAQSVSAAADILAIVVVYAAVKAVLQDRRAGLIAAALLAISYNHAVWGGFILTEPLETLMVALVVWQLWRQHLKPISSGFWPDRGDLLTGLLLALAILTRYENAILVIPALAWASPTLSLKRGLSIVTLAVLVPIGVLSLLHPISGGLSTVWNQISSYLPVVTGGASLVLLAVAAYYGGIVATPRRQQMVAWASSLLLTLFTVALVLDHRLYLGLWEFAIHDPLISILALVGLLLMLTTRRLQSVAAFVLLSCSLLLVTYYHTNQTMDRYVAHLLPLLLIPAAYTVLRIIHFKSYWRTLAASVLVIGAAIQVALTYNGLHHQDAGVWFQAGYEEVTAEKVAQITNRSDLIISATPEPYWLATGASVLGVSASKPYLQFHHVQTSQTLIIVDDQSLRDLSPGFANLVSQKLAAYRVKTFDNPTPFRTVTRIELGPKPVMVYKLTLNQIRLLNQ